MRKQELIEAVAEQAGLNKRQADDAVSALFEQITNTLARGEIVQMVGFGSFCVKQRAARVGKNPQTGASIQIPAKRQPSFKAGSQLRNQLNG